MPVHTKPVLLALPLLYVTPTAWAAERSRRPGRGSSPCPMKIAGGSGGPVRVVALVPAPR